MYQTIKSRAAVTVVVNRIRRASLFTFDYAMYLFLASFIALLGLLQDSSVVIVASMLVSPVMGPILASIFGCVIEDKKLRNMGIKNGLISILICLVLGFVVGILFICFQESFEQTDKFITAEMVQRGSLKNGYLVWFIAAASGVAAALSVLGENTSSMVGVAISASLLPPAVNAGFQGAVLIKADNDLITRGIK